MSSPSSGLSSDSRLSSAMGGHCLVNPAQKCWPSSKIGFHSSWGEASLFYVPDKNFTKWWVCSAIVTVFFFESVFAGLKHDADDEGAGGPDEVNSSTIKPGADYAHILYRRFGLQAPLAVETAAGHPLEKAVTPYF